MLSGGMKRRVLIAKAMSHQPAILFLDEPTAGVDVELRKDMWRLVSQLRESGVTIILTTHYIEEAEEIADRIGVINNGEILLIENKDTLMNKLGKKQLLVELKEADATGITSLLQALSTAGMALKDIQTSKSSLEDIFVDLVHEPSQTGSAKANNEEASA